MEMPQKPNLEHRERIGEFGEMIDELTPESERAWTDYLRESRFAALALRRQNERTTETTDAQGPTGER